MEEFEGGEGCCREGWVVVALGAASRVGRVGAAGVEREGGLAASATPHALSARDRPPPEPTERRPRRRHHRAPSAQVDAGGGSFGAGGSFQGVGGMGGGACGVLGRQGRVAGGSGGKHSGT